MDQGLHFHPTPSMSLLRAERGPAPMAKVPSAEEEIEREWVEDSFRAYMRAKQGCTENWVGGIMRSSEPQTVDCVFGEHGGEVQSLDGEWYLALAVIWY